MKRILLSITLAMPFFASPMSLQIKQKQLSVPEKLGALSVRKSEHGFTVLKGNAEQQVHAHDIDPVLRSLSNAQLAKALQTNRIKVSQLSNNDYKLSLQGGLKGGGAGGANAGFWLGRFLGQTIGYGIVSIVSLPALAGGPLAYGAVVAGLAGTCAPLIESASHVTAISGAIIGGVATGPV